MEGRFPFSRFCCCLCLACCISLADELVFEGTVIFGRNFWSLKTDIFPYVNTWNIHIFSKDSKCSNCNHQWKNAAIYTWFLKCFIIACVQINQTHISLELSFWKPENKKKTTSHKTDYKCNNFLWVSSSILGCPCPGCLIQCSRLCVQDETGDSSGCRLDPLQWGGKQLSLWYHQRL